MTQLFQSVESFHDFIMDNFVWINGGSPVNTWIHDEDDVGEIATIELNDGSRICFDENSLSEMVISTAGELCVIDRNSNQHLIMVMNPIQSKFELELLIGGWGQSWLKI